MKRLKWLGIWCSRIAICVNIGTGVGFWTAVAIGYYLVQGMQGSVTAYRFFGCAVVGGMAGAAIGLVAGLLYVATQEIAAYYRRQQYNVNREKIDWRAPSLQSTAFCRKRPPGANDLPAPGGAS